MQSEVGNEEDRVIKYLSGFNYINFKKNINDNDYLEESSPI